MKNIGVLIYTYNRVDDARVNIDIIRNVWEKSKHFENVKIVHSFNGEKSWYAKKELENDLVALKNSWHFQGASDLIDAGIKTFQKKYKNIDYVIVLASDTWLIKPEYVESLISRMKNDKLYLATCSWGLPDRDNIADVGVAIDFFIIDLKWATKNKMFPIAYGKFQKKYKDLFAYQKAGNIMLEKLFLARYLEAVSRSEKIDGIARKIAIEKTLSLKDREPVHSSIDEKGNWVRKMYWPKMGLLTHHEPEPKRNILKKEKISNGKNIEMLLKNKDLSYYNNGVSKMKHNCN